MGVYATIRHYVIGTVLGIGCGIALAAAYNDRVMDTVDAISYRAGKVEQFMQDTSDFFGSKEDKEDKTVKALEQRINLLEKKLAGNQNGTKE